jgi:hypothetical protein
MTLQYLLFDYSEGDDGTGLFDAMAAVEPTQASAVEAEIDTVRQWAVHAFPAQGPVEEGGDWDLDLHVADEVDGRGRVRRVFSVALAGSAAFCAAFAASFAEALS